MTKVEETKLFSVYFHELFWLATNIGDNCRRIFEEAPVPEEDGYIKVSQDLHARINAVLRDAANIKKLLHTSSRKSSRESKREYRFRQLRSEALREELSDIDLSEMLNSKVRNSIEHFDEYVDKMNLELIDEDTPPAPVAAYNMAISDWGIYEPHPFPIRLYVAAERKFYNMKGSIDLDEIENEANAIITALREKRLAPAGDEGPGGMLVHLTD